MINGNMPNAKAVRVDNAFLSKSANKPKTTRIASMLESVAYKTLGETQITGDVYCIVSPEIPVRKVLDRGVCDIPILP
jgi:hypothetical protein